MIVYILKSDKDNRHYVGVTTNVVDRIKRHNEGRNLSTKPNRPWRIVYTEEFEYISEALKRGRQIKSYKGGNTFKKLINNAGIV